VKKTQDKGYNSVQGHSRSSRSVPIESPYAIVINSNWHPISYRLGVITAYCSNFAPTRWLWLKISGRRGRPPSIIFERILRPMNALQLCPWQFSHSCYGWGAKSENRSKIGDFAPTRPSKISGTTGRPPIIFAQLVRPMNALKLCSFQTKKLCSRLSSSEVHFLMEICRLASLRPPLGNLGAMYDDHLRLIGKRVVDFLLALIELSSLGVTAEELRAIFGSRSAISLQRGSVDPKFQVEGVVPHQPFFFSVN